MGLQVKLARAVLSLIRTCASMCAFSFCESSLVVLRFFEDPVCLSNLHRCLPFFSNSTLLKIGQIALLFSMNDSIFFFVAMEVLISHGRIFARAFCGACRLH